MYNSFKVGEKALTMDPMMAAEEQLKLMNSIRWTYLRKNESTNKKK